ncbi:MAG TPA: DUF2127 domain-containing protein [Candidatus Saccharimonadia bacterium]|nr:DUF2127 domain-containing protein [Candidatus Saccharimonadia bacterium]
MAFVAKTRLDKIFEVGILLKAANGLIEIIGGILCLLIRPETIQQFALFLTQDELSDNPHDFIASHILHTSQGLTRGVMLFAAAYLLSHGIVKVVLVIEIFYNRLWAYPGLIIVTSGFIVYQLYRLSLGYSFWLVALTVFDFIIVYLTVKEYAVQRQRRGLDPAPPTKPAPRS